MTKHEPTWAYGATFTRQFSPVFGLRGDFIFGRLKVYKPGVIALFRLYTSDFIEGDIIAKLSISDLLGGYKQKRLVNILRRSMRH